MTYLLDHHRAVADPLGRGDNAPGFGLFMGLDRGLTFPWRAGGVALLRRQLYPSVGEWQYCGLAIGEDAQLKNYPGMGHSVSQAYQYAAVGFLGNGMISAVCEPVRLDFDSNGDLITPRLPNAVVNVAADVVAAGKFHITWEYEPYGHGAYPADFQVFEGPDANNVDYNTPLTTTSFVGGRRFYDFTTGVYGDLTAHVFAVRGRNSSGVAELNTITTVSQRARAAVPAAAPSPTRVRVAAQSRKEG